VNLDSFLNGLPEGSLHRNTVQTAATKVAMFSRTVAGIKSNKRLSAVGHAEQIKQAGEREVEFFTELRRQHAGDLRALERRQAHFVLQPLPPDKRSVDPREIRDRLSGVPMHEQLRHALVNHEVANAILFAPEFLTGVTGEARDRLYQAELERQFGADQLQAVAEEAAALDTVGNALTVAEKQLRIEAGLPPDIPPATEDNNDDGE
jgi:hypothetical protein